MNSRFPQRDVSWRTGGPSVHASGDGREGAYTATLFAAPSGGTCKVVIPEVSPNWETAFCSVSFTGSPGDRVLVMFDENKTPWVITSSGAPGYEWAYQQMTASVTVASTTEAAGTLVMTAPSFMPDGKPVICEFFSPFVETGPAAGSIVFVSLFEGSTQITRLGIAQLDTASGGSFGEANAFIAKYRFTPTSAAHTYRITAHGASLTAASVIGAGPGGTAGYPPAFVRFVKV